MVRVYAIPHILMAKLRFYARHGFVICYIYTRICYIAPKNIKNVTILVRFSPVYICVIFTLIQHFSYKRRKQRHGCLNTKMEHKTKDFVIFWQTLSNRFSLLATDFLKRKFRTFLTVGKIKEIFLSEGSCPCGNYSPH